MNNTFAFINTSPEPVGVIYTFLDPDTGERVEKQEILETKRTASSQGAQARFGLDKKLRLVNAEIKRANGAKFSVMAKNDAFGNIQDILKSSIIIDIETLGKESGSVITQMGAYDVGTGKGTMYVFQPSLVEQEQVITDKGFANRTRSRLKVDPNVTFKELKYAEFLYRYTGSQYSIDEALEGLRADPNLVQTVEKKLLEQDYFQGRYFASEDNLIQELRRRGYGQEKINKTVSGLRPIRTFMQALGSTMTESDVDLLLRQTRGDEIDLKSIFSSFELRTNVDMKDFLTKDMPDLLRGKVTWIANAAFESTQFGAQIDAEAFEAFRAYNQYRVDQGLDEIESKKFFPKFAYGGFEEELIEINKGRINPVITKNPMYGITQGVSTFDSKPFYTTGAEYSAARAKAAESGDWSKLYKTFLKTTRAGDVRDIIDLVKMQQSTLINHGFITSSTRPSSMSMEIQARIYGVTEALRLGKSEAEAYKEMFQKELHIGIGDVRLSEFPVMREALDQLEALRLVEEGGEAGRILEAEAAQGRGAYYRAQVYGEIMDILNSPHMVVNAKGEQVQADSLHDVLFKKRIADNLLDLSESGTYELRERAGFGEIKQLKDVDGVTVEQNVRVNRSKKTRYTNVNFLLDNLAKTEDYYSADKLKIVENLRQRLLNEGYIDSSGNIISSKQGELAGFSKQMQETFGDQIKAIEVRFEQHRPEILTRVQRKVRTQSTVNKVARKVGRSVDGQVRRILNSTVTSSVEKTPSRSFVAKKMAKYSSGISKFKRGYLGAAAIMVGASFIPKPEKKNLLLGSKEEFIRKRAKNSGISEQDYINALKARYNQMDGLPEKGLASLLRKQFTDFGSPYQSPYYSISVLQDHQMRREREKYISAQFGARHFSAEGDIGFYLKRFIDSAFRREMGFSKSKSVIIDGTPIDAQKYNSLGGQNLTEYVVPEGSNITVEDADTITIRDVNRSRPDLARITGDPGEMRIRLAGIDAPETAHAGRAAQPFAEEAKRIATEMISKAKDVRIVAQKGNSTYGRQVAMVYADGVNVNLELLKRGAAAYLPYKSKKAPAIYNEQAFEEAQERAYKSKRGMWRQPFFQAYKMITDVSNQTTTFNTLVNMSKVAKNGHLMSMRSMMDQAQEMGIDSQMELELSSLGKSIGSKENPFSPDSGKNQWSEMDLQMYGGINNSILSVLDRQKHEIGNLMSSRGSLTQKDKNRTSKLTQNNVEMTRSVLAQKEYKEENQARHTINNSMRKMRLDRLRKMEQMQQAALGNQFNSPIGHYRM